MDNMASQFSLRGRTMKAVTEFPSFTLSKAIKAKADLTAAGKTPEEVQQSLGETFKFEGDKLKHFVNAVDVAGANGDSLKRVMVITLAEGEAAPQKAVQVEDHYYVPEFLVSASPAAAQQGKGGKGGGRGGNRRGGESKKGSPWGLSPEEKAAKNAPKAPAGKPS